MKEKPKAIFIDWNGTLSTSFFWGHLEESNPEVYGAIQDSLFKGELAYILDPWMVGDHTTEEVIAQLAEQTGLNVHMLFREFVHACKTMQLVSPEITDLVSQIRNKGLKVVIATDNMDSFNRWTSPALKLTDHFDAILNSYDLNARKKDFDDQGNSLFFGTFLEDQELLPEETILIDDSIDRDSRLSNYGIRYRKIEFGKGLSEELQKIISEI